MLFKQNALTEPFNHWIFKDRENQRILLFTLTTVSCIFLWLKSIYPYPNFMPPDSLNYLEAAYNKSFINIWPIGYSLFLQLVGIFSHSALLLVIIQYFGLQASIIYLLLTLRYIMGISKLLFRLLVLVSTTNPLLPHIANFVSSDCLFTTLSITWCTQLIWVIYRPNLVLLILHAVTLLFAFMVRHNALYYPLISIIVIIVSQASKFNKVAGISAIALLLCVFWGGTQYEYKLKTDTIQYSAFGGWQMAANSLYGYAHAVLDSPENVPEKFRMLHTLVNNHMDSLRRLPFRPDSEIGIYYLWDFKSPLRLHMDKYWKHDSSSSFFKKWAAMGPLYSAYGRYLALNYPTKFTKHFLWPNLQRYFAPPSFFMGVYNMGRINVEPIASRWFGWKSSKLITNTNNLKISLADLFMIIMPIVNSIFLTGLLSFFLLGGFKNCSLVNKKIIWCTVGIWMTNSIFIVLSAPIELRYLLFPLTISSIWALIFVFYIVSKANLTPHKKIIINQLYQ